ncbi:sentrin-specific protease 2-like [Mizuhopecten yessoensis]|uniref:sentrin-specific protease 2-like n=1 Tax=Mizuhopecten yessoensis TaxID=6573 RepID=UPI000B45F07F|nr:sentrin-specific protease 2-like [Mizuhopecten yessoensis]
MTQGLSFGRASQPDQIINSFVAVLKMNQNSYVSMNHVFVLPTYTAVQWDQGRLDHWMFQKVQFSMKRHVLMPICVHGNHWVLMVVDIRKRTVTVLDSMHGQVGHRLTRLWTQFMADRDRKTEISEKFGRWNSATPCSRLIAVSVVCLSS